MCDWRSVETLLKLILINYYDWYNEDLNNWLAYMQSYYQIPFLINIKLLLKLIAAQLLVFCTKTKLYTWNQQSWSGHKKTHTFCILSHKRCWCRVMLGIHKLVQSWFGYPFSWCWWLTFYGCSIAGWALFNRGTWLRHMVLNLRSRNEAVQMS